MVLDENVLEVNNLSAAFGDNAIFRNVTFTVKKGQFIGLLGGNGSGKTTLLRLISGELTPHAGTIIYNGEQLAPGKNRVCMKKGIVLLHQFPTIFPNLYAW